MRSCTWRGLAVSGECCPRTFLRFTTVQGYFYDWRDDGLFEKINFALLLEAREAAGREASPSAGVNRQSIGQDDRERRAAGLRCGQEDQGAQAPYCGPIPAVCWLVPRYTPADIQDRDGAVLVIEAIHQLFPWLRHLFADSVYNGPNLRDALAKFGKLDHRDCQTGC